jgi:hypothetical protein
VAYKKQKLLTLQEHLRSSPVHLFFKLCCSIICLYILLRVLRVCLRIMKSNILSCQMSTFWVPCCDVCYHFRINTRFGSSLPQVICRRYQGLFTLFVFVFVVCAQCYQFLWIVHTWLPLSVFSNVYLYWILQTTKCITTLSTTKQSHLPHVNICKTQKQMTIRNPVYWTPP